MKFPERLHGPAVMGAFLLVVALRDGPPAAHAVASLYPATTVVLAQVVLHERIGRQRLVGLALGLVGLAMIATR